ncbi:MAG: glycine cleavage system aminomethyltransferase GcvT [Clostridiales bacterium]|nr:glycine cleavage system aminomethyltransferase GcvT [Clostridiales bacterium]
MRTPLYNEHVALNAKIVDFHGWELPIQYTSIISEHEATRSSAGLFDVSHMGEILVEGKGALEAMDSLLTNDITRPLAGKAIYSPMCYDNGGTVDDLIVYKISDEKLFVVVNASNADKDYEWISSHIGSRVCVTNLSSQYAQLALQGPKATEILSSLTDYDLSAMKPFTFAENVKIAGVDAFISRTGYTGEDGFEIYITGNIEENAPYVWRRILEKDGVVPVGLGARDTLRFESCLPLYGQELSADISPVMAGLTRFININGREFIGKDAIADQLENSPAKKLIALEPVMKGIPREGCEVIVGDTVVGYVTSGSVCPTLQGMRALALVDSRYADENEEFSIIIRGKALVCKKTQMPFYKRKK